MSAGDPNHLESVTAATAITLEQLQERLNSIFLAVTNAVRTFDDVPVVSADQRAEEATITSGGRDVPIVGEDSHGVLDADRYLQEAGLKTFTVFEEYALKLDSELVHFASAASGLGSSVGVLSSSHNLRVRMRHVLHLFRKNAAALYPLKDSAQANDMVKRPGLPVSLRKSWYHKAPWLLDHPMDSHTELKSEDLPEQLCSMERDLSTFLTFVNEFPESFDEDLNDAIFSVNEDLKYWVSCLKKYKGVSIIIAWLIDRGRFETPEIRRYVHTMCSDLGKHVATIASSLSVFVQHGVPAILAAQTHANQSLLNISTVATIFTAVTATTLQFSFNVTGRPLADAVNACWFTSLVLSIGAAVNSWLAVSWRQAMYRSPRHMLPWWVHFWINSASLAFLVLSVACFSLGLILFSFSSNQHIVTRILTSVFSACSIIGLASVSTWFGLERRTFSQHRGRKWLTEVVTEQWSPVQTFARTVFEEVMKQMCRIRRSVGDGITRIWSSCKSLHSKLSTSAGVRREGSSPTLDLSTFFEEEVVSDTDPPQRFNFRNLRPRLNFNPLNLRNHNKGQSPTNDERLQHLQLSRSSSLSSFVLVTPGMAEAEDSRSRLLSLVQSLEPTSATFSQTPVRRLHFSSDGEFLLSMSPEGRPGTIFKTETNGIKIHRNFSKVKRQADGPAVWSPTKNYLFVKLKHGYSVRMVENWRSIVDVVKGTNLNSVKTIAWLPTDQDASDQGLTLSGRGAYFFAVRASNIGEMDRNLQIVNTHLFEDLELHSVVVTGDRARYLIVGTLTQSPDGFRPHRGRSEKQIIVYNARKQEIEYRVPILQDARYIALAKDNKCALLSYEDNAPPELWRLEKSSAVGISNSELGMQLVLKHTYLPKAAVDFNGPSSFGGPNDELVLSVERGGDVYIWDRDEGVLLRHIQREAIGKEIQCVACSPSLDPCILAMGAENGEVIIWTPPRPLPGQPPSNSGVAVPSSASTVLSSAEHQAPIESPAMPDAPPSEQQVLETKAAPDLRSDSDSSAYKPTETTSHQD